MRLYKMELFKLFQNKIFKIDALKESNGVKCEYYDGFINFKNKLICK